MFSPFSVSRSLLVVEYTDGALFSWNLVVCSMSIPQPLTHWPLTPKCTHTNTYTPTDMWGFQWYTVYNIMQSDSTLYCGTWLNAESPYKLLLCTCMRAVCVCYKCMSKNKSLWEDWHGQWLQFIGNCSWRLTEQSKVSFFVFRCQSKWLYDLWSSVSSVTSSKRDEKTSIPLEDSSHSSLHLCPLLEPSVRHKKKSMS